MQTVCLPSFGFSCLEWGLRICISSEFSGDLDATRFPVTCFHCTLNSTTGEFQKRSLHSRDENCLCAKGVGELRGSIYFRAVGLNIDHLGRSKKKEKLRASPYSQEILISLFWGGLGISSFQTPPEILMPFLVEARDPVDSNMGTGPAGPVDSNSF